MAIILDFGSGNTCNNDKEYIKRMIDELVAVDPRHEAIVIKWQLWNPTNPQENNIPLTLESFNYAYNYAKNKEYNTTASVFDKYSLFALCKYEVPFIKIANNRELDWLIGETPRKHKIYRSVNFGDQRDYFSDTRDIYCVSKYPAQVADYNSEMQPPIRISDHTAGLELYKKFRPVVWEKHYKLEDSTGLDAGPWAITPKELKEVLYETI